MEPELRQLQLKCLEILDIIIGICDKYQVKYSLCGGSVVGAHLYKGFLPWDDDIDIMMTRDNYNKFLEVAQTFFQKVILLSIIKIVIFLLNGKYVSLK